MRKLWEITCERSGNSLVKYFYGCSPKELLVWEKYEKAIGKQANHKGTSFGIWIAVE